MVPGEFIVNFNGPGSAVLTILVIALFAASPVLIGFAWRVFDRRKR